MSAEGLDELEIKLDQLADVDLSKEELLGVLKG